MNERIRILMTVALVLFAFVISDYFNSKTELLQLQIQQHQHRLSKYITIVKQRDRFKKLSDKIDRYYEQIRRNIPDVKESSEGFLILQQAIKKSAKSSTVKIKNLSPLDVQKKGMVTILSLRFVVEGTLSEFGRFLRLLYSDGPLIGIKSVLITRTKPEGKVRAQLTLEGYVTKRS